MKKNILLVEYSNSTIETINELLSHPIFNITVVDEGESAKNLLKKTKFDMIITAAMLPKFHGFNLSQFAASNYPDLRIIIISEVYKGMDYKHQAITQYKADDFFEKPLDKESFKKRVLELLSLEEKDLKEKNAAETEEKPLSDTKKIPTFKKMEEDEQSLTSEDIFGDIINQVQQSSSFEIELEEDKETEEESKEAKPEEIKEEPQPQMEQKKDEKKESDPKMEKKEEVEKEVEPEKTPDKPEETSEAPQPKKISETPKKPTSIITPGPHDITDTLLELKKVKKETKDDKKFKKLEDDITKKFESTLSGLGLDSKKRPIKKEKPPEPAAPKPIDAKYKERRRDEVGGYDILGLVARGGMAEIYKAKKKGVKGFEKIIAIKKILAGYGKDDKYIEMFVDEAKISAELSHPNIVPIYDLGKKDDYYFIAMEYVTGKDLRLILRKLEILDKQLPEEISIYTIMKVLDALDYAHNAKNSTGKKLDIVHRDISPPNILISFDGEVKLTDFGVSKASIKMHQTVAGALKGKLLYMSPEQASGDFNIDYRSDLFSVGIILFELITGEKLFMNPSEMAVLKKVQTGEIIKPSEMKKNIDSELERIILKLLEKDRGKRYQSASDTLKDLEKYILNQYDHMPTPTHISHTIFDLFKEEIMREGIKIELKTIPYSIKKIKKEEREKEKEPVELKQEEMIETKEEVKETPPEPAPPKKEKVEEKVGPLFQNQVFLFHRRYLISWFL